MARQFDTFEHPADIGLSARADSFAELLEALGEGLAAQVCPLEQVRAARMVTVEVAAEDREALVVDFLSALLRLVQVDRLVIASVAVSEADPTRAAATVGVEPIRAGRHELDAEIKAVTYHQLAVENDGAGWTARVILDV